MSELERIAVENPALLPLDAHNRELASHAHPPEWENPRPNPRGYHLVVLGGGTAGLVAAAGAAGLGARVALVERGLLGGDCLNVGCVPSKALLRSARALADAREAERFGVRGAGGARIDFAAVMERMRALRARLAPHDSARRFRELGVDVFLGAGRFADERTLEVGGARLRFARAVIATGGRAALPDVPGLAEAGVLTNETVFSLTELPARLAILGGGPIGCELAQAFARFGSRVSVIENGPRVLAHDDEEAAAIVAQALERDGVELLTETELVEVRRAGGAHRLTLRRGAERRELEADALLVAAGRAPNVEGLGLERAGVRFDPRRGVEVDDALRTANRRIYAAGDVCAPQRFTHVADATARIVIQNALFSLGPIGRARYSKLVIPWCTYTDPELAHVGATEGDLRERGVAFERMRLALGEVDRALLDGEEQGLLVVLRPRGKDRVLGATLVARHAGETIAELGLAVANGIGLKALASAIHPYPTQAEIVRRAGDAYNRTRLGARTLALLRALLALRQP